MQRILQLLFLVLFSSPTITEGATYLVDPYGSGDFPTIQAAIAATVDGDIIELTDGTFLGDGNRNIDFGGRAITVRSRSGDPSSCIIDPQGTQSDHFTGFYFHRGEGAESVVEGVTVTNGYATTGGAVYCRLGSSPTIRECRLVDNAASSLGGAIGCIEEAFPQIIDCYIADNECTEFLASGGGGIGCDGYDTGTLTISGSSILRNRTSGNWGGGGLVCAYVNSLALTDCIFEGNVSDEGGQGGGGIMVDHCGDLQVAGCSFIDNHALDNFSGGAALCLFINGGFTDCHFEGNSGLTDPFGGGGAVSANWGGISFERCTFKGNTVDDDGGALYLYSLQEGVEIRDCTFWDNEADEYGGAIAVRGEIPAVITGCTMFNNSAPTAACVLCAQGSSIEMANSILSYGVVGDAVHAVATGTSVTMLCCDVYGNEGGDWVDCIYGQDQINGNLSLNPIFCAPAWDDFTIADSSPCAPFSPPNPECDLIGAWPIGCGAASVPDDSFPPSGQSVSTTWGSLKTGYGR